MKIKTCRDKKWAHITEANWSFARSSFKGHPVYLSLIDIKSNDQDMIVKHGYGDIFINRPGIKWIQVIPSEGPYWFTSMFSEKGEFLQLYIDIVGWIDHSDPEDPSMSDMYLDIIVEQDLQLYLIDRDELDSACAAGEIDSVQYQKAIRDAEAMMKWLERNKEKAVRQLKKWYKELTENEPDSFKNSAI
ncbi:MAG: DUF402 domain-containing protein [Erysipelotrichaceae bacterium]|nr:DUF402 domain-containing protein [Erysipelotrichaceae bacterium]